MHNTQKNVFVYFVIIIFIITWGGGWLVQVLGYRRGSENSNFNLNKLCLWHHHNDLYCTVCRTQKRKKKNKQTNNKFFWHWIHRSNATLDSSIVQSRNK